jgi:hypothetical protein
MTAYDALLFGGSLAGFDARTLRWLHREHCWQARWHPPATHNPAWHLREAARCRREISRRKQ